MYCVIVLFVLLSAPLMGMMVEMHGAPERKEGDMEDSAAGGGVGEDGGMEEVMGSRNGGGVRDGENLFIHYEEDEFGGSWFDGFKKMITEL